MLKHGKLRSLISILSLFYLFSHFDLKLNANENVRCIQERNWRKTIQTNCKFKIKLNLLFKLSNHPTPLLPPPSLKKKREGVGGGGDMCKVCYHFLSQNLKAEIWNNIDKYFLNMLLFLFYLFTHFQNTFWQYLTLSEKRSLTVLRNILMSVILRYFKISIYVLSVKSRFRKNSSTPLLFFCSKES